jgi:RNA-splicing ligase RtcB
MMNVIIQGLGILKEKDDLYIEQFSTIHNYIDTDIMILRKGAVSAQAGEKFIIPINMRDGSIICEGLGNPDWNYSAPHGAGRLMSRTKAFEQIKFEDFKKSMEGIYSSSVRKETIDESPFAYKNMDEIIANIKPTAKILKIIKPVYNFKAAEGKRRKFIRKRV